MSTNYTCNQFDKAYKPTRLGNWEVPKWHINRPKGRSTVTKVIANDRGHLLPGVQKSDQKHWAGLYLGTYQLPKRISKEIATELISNPKCQTWMRRSYHHPFIDRSQQSKNENNKLENINMKKQSIANEETDRDSVKSMKSAISYLPATAESNNSTAETTLKKCTTADRHLNSTLPNDNNDGNMKTPSSPALSRISAATVDHRDEDAQPTSMADKPSPLGRRHGDTHRHHGLPDAIEDAVYRSLQTKRHKNPGLGLNGCWPKCSAVAYKSFNDPGPTQCSKLRVYRPKTSSSTSLSGNGEKKESVRRRTNGGAAKNSRPKTCVPVMTAQELTDIKLALCWDLDAPFDRNRPLRPPDEPAVFHKVQQQQQQQPCEKGIGGGERKPQNSSAVMGFVSATPAAEICDGDENMPEARRMQTRQNLMKNRNLSAVMELIANKDHIKPAETAQSERNCDVTASAAADRTLTNKPSSSSSSSLSASRSKNSLNGNNKCDDGKDCDNCIDDGKSNDFRENVEHDYRDDSDVIGTQELRRRRSLADSLSGRHRHQSLQDVTAIAEKETKSYHQQEQQQQQKQKHVFRSCLACDNPMTTAANKKEYEECDHYKMAFKAGVPVSTPVKNRTAAASKPAKHLKVPKPKTTNSDKKKYVIGTLLPPFSMWPGTTARDYPEHWRLTSVYRQAFKPLELRKQPLLQTVYL